jgi:hypothetical protein
MIYSQLIRFLLPLVVTAIVQAFSGQVLNAGMARVPRATETLAAYGLAWGLVSLLASPLSQVRQLGLVLVDGRQAYRTVLLVVISSGIGLAGVLAVLAQGAPGIWLIERLHGVDAQLSDIVREAMLWLVPFPLLRGLALFYSGLLMRVRRTDLVSLAVLSSIGSSILAVVILLPTSFVQERPINLPILVTFVGVLVDLLVVWWGYRRHARHGLGDSETTISVTAVIRFFWPLALIMVIQGFSRPLINLFVSREPGGAESLAVLTIVYALAHMFYGWVNEIRNLPAAFGDRSDNLPQIFRFAIACGLISFAMMVTMFWTPLREYVLEALIGIEAELSSLARAPLIIFTFFPLAVMLRAYLHGIGLFERRTSALAPSAPARIIAILVALLILPMLGINGATRGVAALLSGFTVETLTVWWAVHKRPKRVKVPGAHKTVG